MTSLQFPEKEYVCLRTATVIERFGKEFKLRVKPTEMMGGDRFCYTLRSRAPSGSALLGRLVR